MTFVPHTVANVTLLQSCALLLPVILTGWATPGDTFLALTFAALTAVIWEMTFSGIRKRSFSTHGITTALIVSLFCPPDIPLWQIAFAVSLGATFGELIFGGRGFGFVSPAALTLSVLIVAFPDVTLRATTSEVALTVLPGLALLLTVGLVSLSILAAVCLCVVGLLAITGQVVELTDIAVALSVGAVFLFADPSASSVTPLGRWVYGGLAGAMVVVFSPSATITAEAVVAASLLASVFAPLIDHGAARLHVAMRRHHG